MRNLKKLASLLLALVMVFSLATTAFADETATHKITLTYEKSGHTYTAYQVFKGDISNGKLTNIDWGTGVDGAALLTALRSDATIGDDFSNKNDDDSYVITTAEQVADVLATYEDDSARIEAFARLVSANLTTTAAGASSSSTEVKNGDTVTGYKYEISVTGDGYYFVKDTGTIADDDAETKYILQVLSDVNIEAKAEAPELTKKIIEGVAKVDANEGSIGEKVEYEVKSSVPEMDGYNNYFFIVNDTMSPGLTFNNDVSISIAGTTLAANKFTVTTGTDKDGNSTIKIVIKDFIDYANNAGAVIAITYSATINENAVIGETGNINKAHLVYSRNPNVDTDGDEPEGDEDKVTGKTPDDEVITYVSGIQLNKVDSSTTALAGAKFSIYGTSLKVVVINDRMFKEDTSGTYYRLKDGTYTTTEATDQTKDQYESTTVKYSEVTVVTEDTVATEIETEAWVDKDGVLKFEGLGAGTYTITEIVAPDGYNKIETPITVAITFNANGETKWTATKDGQTLTANELSLFEFDVVNKQGSTLPSTGGMGTTLFYVFGGILVVAAVVLLVTKKRMNAAE